MKKFFVLFLTFTIILSTFTACDGSNYKKAVKLMNKGNYEEAKAIFSEISDYKDSAELISDCNWGIVLSYYSNRKIIDKSEDLLSMVTIIETNDTKDGLSIQNKYFFKFDESFCMRNLDITINAKYPKSANIECSQSALILDEIEDGIGTVIVDLSEYEYGDSLPWNIEAKIEGVEKPSDKTFNVAFSETYNDFVSNLSESGLGITLEDLGID